MKLPLHILSIPFLLFLLNSGSAQNVKTRKLWCFGIVGAPEYAYRTLKNGGGITSKDLFNTRDSIECPKVAYSIGIDIQRYLSPKFILEFGAFYSMKGENTKTYSMQSTIASYPTSQKVKYQTSYLEIPLKINYRFTTRQISPYVTGGISGNIFLTEQVTEYNSYSYYGLNGPTNTVVHYNGADPHFADPYAPVVVAIQENGYYRINPQLQLGFGMDYVIDRFKLKIEPMFKYSLTDVNDGPLIRKFYSIGLNIGVFLLSGSNRVRVYSGSGNLN
ncbi:MAG: outer membrane beta-barrel protein [Bacteroidetes bacterium]|nr:outer membrane beta-barrel protein [Bacteroidota bacterium]